LGICVGVKKIWIPGIRSLQAENSEKGTAEKVSGLLPESQGQNLALAVLCAIFARQRRANFRIVVWSNEDSSMGRDGMKVAIFHAENPVGPFFLN